MMANYRGEKSMSCLPTNLLHTLKMNRNVLSRSIRDVHSLYYLSNANTDLVTPTECFMPLKYLRYEGIDIKRPISYA